MSENNKIILLEWDRQHQQYVSLRFFEYNGIEYPPGALIKPFIVDLIKSDKKEREKKLKINEKNYNYVVINEIRLACMDWERCLNDDGIQEFILKDIIFKDKKDIARFVKEMMKYIE